MVDQDIVRAKASAIVHHIERLRARSPLDRVRLSADEDLRNIVLMDLQQAIQSAIDLACHVASFEGLEFPEGPGAAFACLAKAGIVTTELSIRLAGAAGLRNLIVHRYGDLSTDLVASTVDGDLGDLEAFVAAIRTRFRV